MKKNLRFILIRVFVLTLLVLHDRISFSQIINYTNNFTSARTFVNISKPNGGVFDPGDTIEVRYTILVDQSPQPSGGSSATQIRNILKSAQLIDTLPNNVLYINNSLRILTNEGILYRGPFTEANDADLGTYTAGFNNIVSIKARPPRFANNSFGMITYRIRVNAAYNQFITFNKASLWFRGIADAAPLPKYKFPQSVIAVFQSPGLCTNGLAVSNVFESGGTFSTGKPRNRGTASPIVPTGATGYTFVTAGANQPNDGYYAIVNNTSDAGSKDTTKNGTFASPKIFDVFDIFGDHTGATNQLRGNAPTDTATAAPGGGYMLMVNASYATNAAISQTINNVCKNTYYEFSAWFRNICPRCAADSLGNGSTTWGPGWPPNPAYLSYAGNDSAGAKPNLAFEINDTTYYTSGNLDYDKSQTAPWKKRGFLFLNNLDSFKITIRNNSPGGGGNDWVMDDVTVSGCVPTLKMNYTPYVLGCSDNGPTLITFSDTIRYSYNGSYVYSKWQRSTNNGVSWSDVTGTLAGPAVPNLIAGLWQYVTNYTFLANQTDSGHRYRVVVATTFANLSSSTCAFTDGSYTYLRFIKCSIVVGVNLLSFTGNIVSDKGNLLWRVNEENNFSHYEIEKSLDGRTFFKIGEVQGRNATFPTAYNFNDNEKINGIVFYRLKMVNKEGLPKYSNVVTLSTRQLYFDVKNVTNPFDHYIVADYITPESGETNLQLFDAYGRLLMRRSIASVKGLNSDKLDVPQLSAGFYTIRITYHNTSITKRLIKNN